MNCKERLKEYINKDKIYQDYKQNKLINFSDFDKFCIQHCKDIEKLLEENLELEQALDEIEKHLKNDIESCNSALSNPEYTIISKHELLKNEKQKDIDILKIIQKAKGDVKNENNNV